MLNAQHMLARRKASTAFWITHGAEATALRMSKAMSLDGPMMPVWRSAGRVLSCKGLHSRPTKAPTKTPTKTPTETPTKRINGD